jgi:hypothetical protein
MNPDMKARIEIRNPNTETRKKTECRNPKASRCTQQGTEWPLRQSFSGWLQLLRRPYSVFGLRPSFGLRISDFGFGAQPLLGAWMLLAMTMFPLAARSADTNTPAPSARPKDAEAQADTFARYAMPGPEHKVLDRMAGSWDTLTRYWPTPNAEPVEAKGTSQRKWILDGRFLLEEIDGGNLVLPFKGLALYGYDAFEQKHTSAWVDTMNTSILTNLGTYDRTNDVVNFTGQYKDPWTGARKKERGVTRFVSKDKHVLEIYPTEPDGKEFKMLEITYTRRAPASK